MQSEIINEKSSQINNVIAESPNIALNTFLKAWDVEYANSLQDVPLFDVSKTSQWTIEQKQNFVRWLYHARGHFHDVLWYMGNFAPDEQSKKIILDNMEDEFNRNGSSHENLYLIFAKSVGVDLTYEGIKGEFYLPFLREFNEGHLRWLREHDWESRAAFFAALERLDNVDYVVGKKIAESLGLQGQSLVFFNVHIYADHFNPVLNGNLVEGWQKNPEKVKEAFAFISKHQSTMWKNLSDAVFNCVD